MVKSLNISVIIPVFNSEKTIKKTLISILPQLEIGDEIIVTLLNLKWNDGYNLELEMIVILVNWKW